MSFVFYDLAFLVLFTLGVIIFLYSRKHNIERQGLLYLYKTKLGIKLMDWTVEKFGRVLKPLQYLIIASGYVLMISMIWLLLKSVWLYLTSPIITQLIRAPPIAPLIPYFPKIFNLEAYFPPLYFTYFLIALVIVAVSHEFAHGIFARLNKIKVKTTGFAFLGPILGAFVEPDEKQMQKAKKFPQLAILAAGTFANVIMTVIFGAIIAWFFMSSFSPAGVNFNTYGSQVIELSSIDKVNGIDVNDIGKISNLVNESFVRVDIDGQQFLVNPKNLLQSIEVDANQIIVFDDAPAVNAGLKGPIVEIDGVKVVSQDGLVEAIMSHQPGETVIVKTLKDGEIVNNEITFGERDGKAYLGIGMVQADRSGITGWFISQFEKVKNPFIYYEPNWNSDLAWFIYYLLWWIVVINILVALFNMLPVSILDGGRFFYLTVWGITGSEKIGRKAFSLATWFILALVVLMMVKWALSFA